MLQSTSQPVPVEANEITGINPVVKSLKRLGSSANFFLVCFLQTFLVVLAFLTFAVLFNEVGTDTQGAAIIGFYITIPFLAYAVLFWVIRKLCKTDSPCISTGGLIALRVVLTVQLVICYMVNAVCTILILTTEHSDAYTYEGYLDEGVSGMPLSDEEWIFLLMILLTGAIVITHLVRGGLCVVSENCKGILSDRSFPLAGVVSFYIVAAVAIVVAVGVVWEFHLNIVVPVLVNFSLVYFLSGWFMGKYRKQMKELRKNAPKINPEQEKKPWVVGVNYSWIPVPVMVNPDNMTPYPLVVPPCPVPVITEQTQKEPSAEAVQKSTLVKGPNGKTYKISGKSSQSR